MPSIAPFLTAFSALLGCGVLAVLCILHLTVRVLGAAQGGATTMHTWQQMSSDIRSDKTAMAKMNDSHVVLAHMIGQQSNLIRGGSGMTCEMYRLIMQSSGHASHAVALPIASQPHSLDMAQQAALPKAVRDRMKKEDTHKKKQLVKQQQAVKARQQALQDKAQQQLTSAAQADSPAESGDDTEEPDFVAAAEAALPGTAAAASSPDTAEDMYADNEVLVEMPGLNSSMCWTTWLGKHRTLSSQRLV